MRKFFEIAESSAVICVGIASAVFVWALTTQRAPARVPPGASTNPIVEDLAGDAFEMARPDWVLARDSRSPVALIEFSDFQCPFCGRHEKNTFDRIKTDLVDTGQLTYGFMHFPLDKLHPDAIQAAEAAECAGDQGKFWSMRAILFQNQDALGVAGLQRLATTLGIHRPSFDACLEKGNATERVGRQMAEGTRLNVKSTPTFFIGQIQGNGRILLRRRIRGAVPYSTFSDALKPFITARGSAS